MSSLIEKRCNCVLAFGYYRVSNLNSRKTECPFIRQEAHCTFENCRHFQIIIEKNQDFRDCVYCLIRTRGNEDHVGQSTRFRRTNSDEQKRIAEMLQVGRPEEVYEELLATSDIGKLLSGNNNKPKSMAVMRRIKSFIASREKLHSVIEIELDIMQRLYAETEGNSDISGFIQKRGNNPFFVIMYLPEQLQLLHGRVPVLYLNATGSIFKKWQGIDKRMLLYSLILPNDNKNEPCVPVCEMICSEHKTEMISHMLFTFRMDFNRLNKQALHLSIFPCKFIVTDFSWALIHSVLHSLSRASDIETYLQCTYESIVGSQAWKPSVGIFICTNHAVHIVARYLSKLKIKYPFKKEFIHSFVLLQYSETFGNALETISLIFNVFGEKFDTKLVKQARRQLLHKIKNWKTKTTADAEESQENKELHDENEKPVDKKMQKAIRAGSPWLEYFLKRWHQNQQVNVNDEVKKSKCKKLNPFFSDKLTNYLIRHWLSLFPLWCMAVSELFGVKNLKSSFSNAHVENWFSSVKSRHLRNSSSGVRIRVTKFIKTQREFIKKRLLRFKLAESRPKKRHRQGDEMHEVEEPWGKKRAKYVKPTSAATDKLFQQSSSSSNSHSDSQSCVSLESGVSSKLHDEPSNTNSNKSEIKGSRNITVSSPQQFSRQSSSLASISTCVGELPQMKKIIGSVIQQLHDQPSDTNSNKEEVKRSRNLTVSNPQQSSKQSKSITSIQSVSACDEDLPQTKKVIGSEIQARKDPGLKLEFMIRSGRLMTLHDKNTVLPELAWLEANVVYGFLECVKSEKCAMWTDSDWRQVQRMRIPSSMEDINWEKVEIIYLPLCANGHFTALFINIKARTFSMLDTLSHEDTIEKNCRAYTAKWNKFVSLHLPQLLPRGVLFRTISVKHPMQIDGSSCGILIALFGKSIAKGQGIQGIKTDAASMLAARKEIWKTLYQNRDTERCCRCRNHKDLHNETLDPDRWLVCSLCGNCVHFECAKSDFLISESESSKKWLCHCCKNAV